MSRFTSRRTLESGFHETYTELCVERKKVATLAAEVQRLQAELAQAQHDKDHFESAELSNDDRSRN